MKYPQLLMLAPVIATPAFAAPKPLVFDLRAEPATARVVVMPTVPPPAPKPPAAKPAPKARVASSVEEAAALIGRIGTVVKPSTSIYDGPGRKKVYARAAAGQSVILTGWNSQWYGVRMIDGRTGWVYRGDIQLLDATMRLPEVQARPVPDGSGAFGDSLTDMSPLLRAAFSYMGIPYKWGGTSTSGIDCSGFVGNVYRKFGVNLPRVARDQAKVGQAVPPTPESLRPGDRLYFSCHHSYIDHTGIYWGNGLFIHSSGGRGVDITPLWDGGTYEKGLVSARRTFDAAP
jgi:N-acetylmuramoyl-L-alanine amidase